jgi:hypothetical protein
MGNFESVEALNISVCKTYAVLLVLDGPQPENFLRIRNFVQLVKQDQLHISHTRIFHEGNILVHKNKTGSLRGVLAVCMYVLSFMLYIVVLTCMFPCQTPKKYQKLLE